LLAKLKTIYRYIYTNMLEEIGKSVLLAFVGFVAGFININAGGGSLLTLPFLIFLGLPPTVANGTNRIAIFIQNIIATAKFHQFKVIPQGIIFVAGIPAIIGSVLGAQIAVEINEDIFKKILALIMVLVIGWMFFVPRKEHVEKTLTFTNRKKIYLAVSFFAIGIYGGFIQGGIGFVLITVLTISGYNLVQTNALKVLIVLIFTPFALAVFVLHGQVDILKGLILAAGNGAGGLLATNLMVKKGEKYIRWIVMIAIVGFAVKLFMS